MGREEEKKRDAGRKGRNMKKEEGHEYEGREVKERWKREDRKGNEMEKGRKAWKWKREGRQERASRGTNG